MNQPGERLTKFANSWRQLKASPEVVRLVKYGYSIKFVKKPPLSKPEIEFATTATPEKMKIIRR